MIAALYVEPEGVYAGLPGVELWDKARDARRYPGPWPVVAHPPCGHAWSHMGNCVPGRKRGEDGGCFEAALQAVRRYGGVLEHPAWSQAWPAFGLPRPLWGGGWVTTFEDPGWACELDQAHYGHPCNKRTRLYFVGADPPPVRFGPAPFTGRRVRDDGGGWPQSVLPSGHGSRPQRSRTPEAFRDLLLTIAAGLPAASAA